MGKAYKFGPTALHSELSEYASLLRALRTSNTLDLSTQLTQYKSPVSAGQTSESEEEPGDGNGNNRYANEGVSDLASSPTRQVTGRVTAELDPEHGLAASQAKSKQKQKQKRRVQSNDVTLKSTSSSSSKGKKRSRDTWSRWPLLEGDTHAPEWGLEDEVKSIALQSMKSQRSLVLPVTPFPAADIQQEPEQTRAPDLNSDPAGEQDIIESEDEDVLLSPLSVQALALSASSHLSHLLSLLSAHFPLAEKSMQNRIKPIGWESVLEIAGTSGFVSGKSLETVQQRLGNIYGSSRTNVSSRTNSVHARKKKFEELRSITDSSFLTLPGEHSSHVVLPTKRKRGSYKPRHSRKKRRDESSDRDEDAEPA